MIVGGVAWKEDIRPVDERWDIAGQQFGELVPQFRVITKTDPDCALWLCHCNCGNELVARTPSLRSGHTGSCGCTAYKRVSKALGKELKADERFGRYTVLYKEDKTGRGGIYRCRCDCGTEKSISRQSLVNGTVVSCGYYNREETSKRTTIDLAGQRFGLLTALSRSDKKGGDGVYWHVRCDCGTETIVSGHSMRRKATISCGCARAYKSMGEVLIDKVLTENNILHRREYIFSDLPRLRFDFAILDEEQKVLRLVEFDGPQHNQPSGFFGGEKVFQQLQEHDNLKDQYALSHNIPLVRIPYKERDNITLNLIMDDKYLFTEPA